MKRLLAIFLFVSSVSYGQMDEPKMSDLLYRGFNYQLIYKSSFDTSVIYKGDTTFCSHKFVKKTVSKSYTTCGVFHDAAGCPDTWVNEFSICRFCLRHIHVKESRWVEQPAKEETYDELLNKLNNKKQ